MDTTVMIIAAVAFTKHCEGRYEFSFTPIEISKNDDEFFLI